MKPKDFDPSLLEYLQLRLRLPWFLLGGFGLAFLAQSFLEPPNAEPLMGLIVFGFALFFLLMAYKRNQISFVPILPARRQVDPATIRLILLVIGLPFVGLAYWFFGGNRFSAVNLSLWLVGVFLIGGAFWLGPVPWKESISRMKKHWEARTSLRFITDHTVWIWLLIVVVIFFRVYRLSAVPPEMYSDHAEKLLDVGDILRGEYPIFFIRNTGREAFQMYLTAAVAQLFGSGLSFNSLKIGTTIAGLFTVPFVYALGKEFGGERVGWLAALFVGIAYWGNVITRVALRYTLFPFFTAPTLFYLVKGLRQGNRNDIIISGLFLGLGLHGYSSFRIVPLLAVLAFVLFIIHTNQVLWRWQAAWHLGVISVFSILIFLPLLRYITESPDHLMIFFYRSFTRVSNWEQAFPEPVWKLFIQETWQAATMFWWNNGDIWVHSVRNRPALDLVMASLFFAGLIFLLLRYRNQKNWMDLFLVLSVFVLLLPSSLSLAFPGENPSLNRSGGALIPVAIISSLGLETFAKSFQHYLQGRLGKWMALMIVVVMVSWACVNNYKLVFVDYANQYRSIILNTSEIGGAAHTFGQAIGNPAKVWVIPYPHWVDTRLVGIESGFPYRDFALWRDKLPDTTQIPGAKAFILHLEDGETLTLLQSLYPNGIFQVYDSAYGKPFGTFFVPDADD